MKKHTVKTICINIICLFFLTSCGTEGNKTKSYTKNGYYLDTIVTCKIYDTSKGLINQVLKPREGAMQEKLDRVMELCQYYDKLFNRFNPESDIYRINNARGEWVKISPETADIIAKGEEYRELTGGRFDLTIGAVSGLWNFEEEDPVMPGEEALAAALKTVGSGIELNGDNVRLLNPEAQIDLGGIAKGYISGKIAEALREDNLPAIINLGGNIEAVGQREDTPLWTIGIQEPFADTNVMAATMETGETSVVSSGIYQRYFRKDGRLYHHLLDPKTGYPADNGLLSVTIITTDSTAADALSTGIFLMGATEGLHFAESLDGVEAVFIDSQGKISYTSGIGTDIPFQPIASPIVE